jgi:hypothetical protein
MAQPKPLVSVIPSGHSHQLNVSQILLWCGEQELQTRLISRLPCTNRCVDPQINFGAGGELGNAEVRQFVGLRSKSPEMLLARMQGEELPEVLADCRVRLGFRHRQPQGIATAFTFTAGRVNVVPRLYVMPARSRAARIAPRFRTHLDQVQNHSPMLLPAV